MYGDYVKRHGGLITLTEETPMFAASPYGGSKVAGFQMARVYRESFDMFSSCGILFNHSAPFRGEEFFTRKVTSHLARIYWGMQEQIVLGNLEAKRDEGFSGDYVRAMHLMLQHESPEDFVIASGETHSCDEWLELSLKKFDLSRRCVSQNSNALIRPNEVNVLVGDASKAKSVLGWAPSVNYQDLNNKMCMYDLHAQSPKASYRQRTDELLF